MRKLMWFAVGFALAVAIGLYCLWGSAYLMASAVAAVALAGCIGLSRRYAKLRIGTAILFGCLVGFVWITIFNEIYLSVPRAADGKKLNMTVIATDYGKETAYGTSVDGVGLINGKYYSLKAFLPENTTVSPGDRLTGRFSLRCTLPGCSGSSDYYAADHTFLTASATKEPDLLSAEKLPWYGYPAYVRQQVKEALYASMPEDTVGFAIALLIGDKEALDHETDTAFKTSGISHVIAVSGLHVTILFSVIYLLMWRKRWLTMVFGLPILFFFAAVAGFSPSILRACIMQALMVAALVFGKEYDPPTALGFAVLTMLMMDPWTVTSVSFQLSVACMVGIFLFTQPIRNWLMDRKRLGRWKGKAGKLANGFSSSVGMSLGATVLVTPLCAHYFRMVSLVGVVTNLLTLWVVTFIFYGVIAVCVLGLIWPVGSIVLGWAVAWPIRYVLGVSKAMAAFPLAAVYMENSYMVLWLIFVYLLLAVHLCLRKKQVTVLSCCAVLSLCMALSLSWLEPLQDECRMTVLDVGQGQCILLQSEGKTFVVDCGGDSDTVSADQAANCLMSQGVFQTDGLILTHYDRDHAAGAGYLLDRVPAQTVYLPNCVDEEGTAGLITDEFSKLMVTNLLTIS